MITVEDIFHKIAQELKGYSDSDKSAAIEEFITGCVFDLRLAITTDMEETKFNFLERYGHGHTFYFRLNNYEQGRRLASQIYWVMQGVHPDMSSYTGAQFSTEDQLYLFVHVKDVRPVSASNS